MKPYILRTVEEDHIKRDRTCTTLRVCVRELALQGKNGSLRYVKRSDMRGAFDALQDPPPGSPQAYRRGLKAKRRRSLRVAKP